MGSAYSFEHHLRDDAAYDFPPLYDEEAGRFCFRFGREAGGFAVSREYADWAGLWEIDYPEAYGQKVTEEPCLHL